LVDLRTVPFAPAFLAAIEASEGRHEEERKKLSDSIEARLERHQKKGKGDKDSPGRKAGLEGEQASFGCWCLFRH
jgi:hypothetical protein